MLLVPETFRQPALVNKDVIKVHFMYDIFKKIRVYVMVFGCLILIRKYGEEKKIERRRNKIVKI